MSQLVFNFDVPSALWSPDEIYSSFDQRLLKLLKEDRRLERKPPGVHARVLQEYFSMWANTAPDGGLVVVGIEDSGFITGCHKLSQEQLNNLEGAPRLFCPDAQVESKRVPVILDDETSSFVLVFRILYREDRVVVDVSGNAYARFADQKHRLSNEEIRELQIDKRQIDFELESVSLSYPDDFNMDLIRKFVDSLKRIRQPQQNHSNEEFLVQRRLGKFRKSDFVPNVACTLLFATDPLLLFPGCKVRFLRVDGEIERSGDQYNVVKDIIIEGPIPILIQEAVKVIRSQLREFSRLGDDGKFYTAPEYPPPAWLEALVNACVHRSYGLRNMNVFVKMFDDKLVIESPGGFPPLVTPQNIYTSHHPRNPHLMNALYYFDLVKEHAEGTKRMLDTMTQMNLPAPEFFQVASGAGHSSVRVTLRNQIKQRKMWVDSDASHILGDSISKNLSSDEKRIVNFIAEHGRINVSQCLRLIPTLPKWHAAKRLLEQMKRRGILIHYHSSTIERDSRAYYALPEVLRPAKEK